MLLAVVPFAGALVALLLGAEPAFWLLAALTVLWLAVLPWPTRRDAGSRRAEDER